MIFRVRVNQHIRFLPNVPLFPLSARVGMPRSLAGMIQGKVGGIQVLAGLAPSSQTIVCNIRTFGGSSHLWKRKLAGSVGNQIRWFTGTLIFQETEINGWWKNVGSHRQAQGVLQGHGQGRQGCHHLQWLARLCFRPHRWEGETDAF